MTYFRFGVHAAGVGGNYDGFGQYVAACNAAGKDTLSVVAAL